MSNKRELEKSLKRFLKRKISFTQSLLVAFLITGSVTFSVATQLTESIESEGVISAQAYENRATSGSGKNTGTNNLDIKLNFQGVTDEWDGGVLKNLGAAATEKAILGNIMSNFKNNLAANNGGAIYNGEYAEILKIEGDFEGNSASNDGGAIYNDGKISYLTGDFKNNLAGGKGGAIYVAGTGDVVMTGDMLFEGNKSNFNGMTGDSNAMHIVANGKAHLAPFDAEVITFNDAVTTDVGSTLNIGGSATRPTVDGDGNLVYKTDANGNYLDSNGDIVYEKTENGYTNSTTNYEPVFDAAGNVTYNATTTNNFDGTTISTTTGVDPDDLGTAGAVDNEDETYSQDSIGTMRYKYMTINGVTAYYAVNSAGNIEDPEDYKIDLTQSVTGTFDTSGEHYTQSVEVYYGDLGSLSKEPGTLLTGGKLIEIVTTTTFTYKPNGDGSYTWYNNLDQEQTAHIKLNPTDGKYYLADENGNFLPSWDGSYTEVTHNKDETYTLVVIEKEGTLQDLVITEATAPADGTVVFNADMSGVVGTVVIGAGAKDTDGDDHTLTVKIGPDMGKHENEDNKFFGGDVRVENDFILDLQNSENDYTPATGIHSEQINMGKWTTKPDATIIAKVDVEFKDGQIVANDKFTNVNGQNITIADIDIYSKNTGIEDLLGQDITFGTGADTGNMSTTVTQVEITDPIHQGTIGVTSSNENGEFKVVFPIAATPVLPGTPVPTPPAETPEAGTPGAGTPGAGTPGAGTPGAGTPGAGTPGAGTPGYTITSFNPEILKTTVAMGAISVHFEDITDRILNKRREKIYSKSVWVDGYTSDETIDYSTKYGGNSFDNKVFITTAGMDFEIDMFENVEESVTAYFGHLNSQQEYSKIDLEQKGYYIGTNYEAIKQEKYMNVTLLGGLMTAKDKSTGDKFDLTAISLASKFGKEHELNEDYTLDPSLILGLHMYSVDDYTNADNVKISIDTMYVFNISPELKLTRTTSDYKPYLVLGYNYNIYSGGEITGKWNGRTYDLPRVEVEQYFEGRLGVERTFDNEWKTYFEIIGRTGDKDSFGGQIGVEYKF